MLERIVQKLVDVAGVFGFAFVLVAPLGGRCCMVIQKGNLLNLFAIRYSEYYLYGERDCISWEKHLVRYLVGLYGASGIAGGVWWSALGTQPPARYNRISGITGSVTAEVDCTFRVVHHSKQGTGLSCVFGC